MLTLEGKIATGRPLPPVAGKFTFGTPPETGTPFEPTVFKPAGRATPPPVEPAVPTPANAKGDPGV